MEVELLHLLRLLLLVEEVVRGLWIYLPVIRIIVLWRKVVRFNWQVLAIVSISAMKSVVYLSTFLLLQVRLLLVSFGIVKVRPLLLRHRVKDPFSLEVA